MIGWIFSGLVCLMPLVLSQVSMAESKSPSPPVAKKVEHVMKMFGDVRVDNYYWLRDDSRSNPEILSYLQHENLYTDSIMSGTKKFEEELFSEIKGRVKEDDVSFPVRKGEYYYYTRTLQGKEYVQYCRRLVPTNNTSPSVYDSMPTDPPEHVILDFNVKAQGHSFYSVDAFEYCRRLVATNNTSPSVYDSMPTDPPEHVILDVNVKAQGHSFYRVDAFEVSPNNKLVAYAEDTKGDEIYTVYIIDAETGAVVGKPLANLTSYLKWAGDEALVYITMDETHRPYKVWLHKLGEDQLSDICLYHEKDDIFSLDLEASESKKFVFVGSASKITRSIFYIDVAKPEELRVLTPRVVGVDTSVSHRGDHFFIRRRTDEFFNSELLACPLNNTSETTLLIPHRESIKIEDIELFVEHLAVYERENGLPKITIYRLPPIGEPLKSLEGGKTIDFIDPVYSVEPSESQFSSSILQFFYSSMKTPASIYEFDMSTGISVLKKIKTVLGGFNSSDYITERKWANASDGTQIPISIVYRNNLVKLDGSDPLLLYGYGSYEACEDPSFNAPLLSLLDRGFIYAIAHIRGGGEMGRQWYENGKLLHKKNTFIDFIACAEYLLENRYCSKEKLCINGGSAGGLLMGAVLNMRPDLFKAAVVEVPFVDALTTMLDPTIPLTTAEWEEWGDPRKEEFYFYMKSYSPVDNVKAQNYPNILVTAGLNDPRVMYSEPAKFVAKLRDMKTDNNTLLFKCEFGAGHSSKSGRFEKLQEVAFTYTFILRALNMIRATFSG